MRDINVIREDYNEYIMQQLHEYEISLGMIGSAIERMKAKKLISENVQITGRIKSFKSAYLNYERDKKIDDCFGLRIVAKQEELVKIREELAKLLTVKSTKDHRKRMNTGYNAVHQMVYLNNEFIDGLKDIDPHLFPLLEIQYWDEETERDCFNGNLSYAHYKHRDIKKMAKQYNENPESVYEELPIYYEIEGKEVKRLSKEETLDRMYPELKTELEENQEQMLDIG